MVWKSFTAPSPHAPIIPAWSRKKALNWGRQEEDMNTGQNEWLFPQYLGWIGKAPPHFHSLSVWMGLYSLRRKVGSPPLPTWRRTSQRLGPRAGPLARPSRALTEGGSPGLWQHGPGAGRCSTGTCEEACGAGNRGPSAGLTQHSRARSLAQTPEARRCFPCLEALRCAGRRAAPSRRPMAKLRDCLPRLMVTIRSLLFWCLVYFCCGLCASIYLLKLLWSICKGPTQTFLVGRSGTPPCVLERPSLGTYCYVRIKVKAGAGPLALFIARERDGRESRGWSLHDAQPSVP